MQEYKRQIAYLYAYERGEQLRSTGFVKAEERGGHCRLALHLRGYCHPGEAAGNVYIYFYHQDRTIGIYLGALKNQNGALEWQGELDAEDILGKGIRFADTHGIWVKRPGGRDYVAEWDDYPVDTKRFVLYPEGGIRQAKKAEKLGEVPIGCVIVKDGKIIARGYNRRNTDKNTLAHAELQAIRKASKAVGDWRLEECTMYITLEPCQMCAGAIVQARIPRVVIGCRNPKAGCAGSILNLLNVPAFNHQVELTEGILQEECSTLLKEFFRKLRKIKVQKV